MKNKKPLASKNITLPPTVSKPKCDSFEVLSAILEIYNKYTNSRDKNSVVVAFKNACTQIVELAENSGL